MTDLSDWIWLIVVAVWIIARLLPRLFRGASRQPTPQPPPKRATDDREAQLQSYRFEKQAPPIEPR